MKHALVVRFTALFDFDMIGISLPLPQNPDDGGAKIAGDL